MASPFDPEVLTVVSIVAVFLIIFFYFENRYGWRLGHDDTASSNCERQLAALREEQNKDKQTIKELEEFRSQDQLRIDELNRRVDFLIGQLQEVGIKMRDLELELSSRNQLNAAPLKRLPAKPLLIVCGADSRMCDADRQSLRRAGIPFQRLMEATRRKVERELRRRRQDDTLYPWVHVTAHADENGVHLADGVAEPEWWHRQIDGIDLVFLAACKTANVADALAGMVTVVFVTEEIDSNLASDFTYAFWRRMKEHADPLRAYNQAVTEVPQVSEYTDIRVS